MNSFHCRGSWEDEAGELIERAKTVVTKGSALLWVDWQRHSNRQKTKIKMGGLVGQASYSGSLGEFLPFLRLGELVHLGKGTVFGLGQYALTLE